MAHHFRTTQLMLLLVRMGWEIKKIYLLLIITNHAEVTCLKVCLRSLYFLNVIFIFSSWVTWANSLSFPLLVYIVTRNIGHQGILCSLYIICCMLWMWFWIMYMINNLKAQYAEKCRLHYGNPIRK